MAKVNKICTGSYYIDLGAESIYIQTNIQACRDHSNPKYWWVTYSDDFSGDHSAEFKTKKEAVAYAENLITYL